VNSNDRYEPVAATGKEEAETTPVRVQCLGFRCLAYRDKKGLWRDFVTHEQLVSVIGVVRYNLTELFLA
jgi:hypothetical protein